MLGPYPTARLGKAANHASVGITFGSHRFLVSLFDRPLNLKAIAAVEPDKRGSWEAGKGIRAANFWVSALKGGHSYSRTMVPPISRNRILQRSNPVPATKSYFSNLERIRFRGFFASGVICSKIRKYQADCRLKRRTAELWRSHPFPCFGSKRRSRLGKRSIRV